MIKNVSMYNCLNNKILKYVVFFQKLEWVSTEKQKKYIYSAILI